VISEPDPTETKNWIKLNERKVNNNIDGIKVIKFMAK
jgi:hypothetical protein